MRGTKRATVTRGEEPSTSKRRRMEPEDPLWQLRPVSDLKMSSIYNRSASEAPAELFRKDLISAMKLPDNEPLTPSEYWIITDTWKQDWERGVQVPVNPDSLPAPKVKIIENPRSPNFQEFHLPKDKYIHLTRDVNYQSDKHILSTTPARAEAACSYDLDATDIAWLKLLNSERARAGAAPINEDQLEKVIEELEIRTWDKIQAIMKSEEGLGIEYDENVICDVCRSPDSEDGNEMVFCDSCNICVHQACYGITVIPDGQWLCRPCGDGVRPVCVLCPNLGGAMKCTPLGRKWAHVSCVLWIPEVSIGCAEKMEPITKISAIPASRWSLVCVLCRERKGACIQCSVKTCKTAYHVTCAFKHGLEMRAIIEDENADDGVKLRSYCQRHSVNSKKEKCPGSGSEEEEVKRKRRKDMTSEEKTQARAARLQEIEREFDKHVNVKDISTHLLDVDQDAIHYIYNYWKLKRRAGHNRPLLPPKSDDSELLTHRQEQADLDKMKMFVQLRQDLERVRNLCYMVSRREKLSRSFFRMREQTFHKQISLLSSGTAIPDHELTAIIEANHGPSIYDRLYSHPNAPDHKNDFDELMARIAPPESGDEKKKDRNGLVRSSRAANPYKKHYVNGSRRSGSMYSGLSSEESAPETNRRHRGRTGSSTDEDEKKPTTSPKKKISAKSKSKRSPKKPERKKKKVPQSKAFVESSSEDETIVKTSKIKKDRTRSKTLQQMEKEMTAGKVGQSGTDSEDLMPMRTTRNNKFPLDIYSDSSEDLARNKSDFKVADKVKLEKSRNDKIKTEKSPIVNDSQQSLPRTKAAMKEFVPSQSEKKLNAIEDEKPAPKKRGRKPSNKNEKDKKNIPKLEVDSQVKNRLSVKYLKKKHNPTDLIVPQRQAAKKASENMRSTAAVKKEELPPEKLTEDSKSKIKFKDKAKDKEIKEVPGKINRKKSKDAEKETIAYVPQRQAAKKAAAHIKGGLGNKQPLLESDNDKKKDFARPETSKISPKKEEIKVIRVPLKQSSSSSSNSSSSSCSSSSSSEEEQEKHEIKPISKAPEIKPAIRKPSMFSPQPTTRPTVDLPFLDKVSKPLSSTSASSDTDSSRDYNRSGSESPTPRRPRRRRKGKSISTDASPRKTLDKKLKTSERGFECRVPSPSVERAESIRTNNARAASRARTRSITASGNLFDKPDAGSRKPSKDDPEPTLGPDKSTKESNQSCELPASEWKANEEIKQEIKVEVTNCDEPVKSEVTIKPLTKMQPTLSEEKVEPPEPQQMNEASPKKNADLKQKSLTSRRMSVKEPVTVKEIKLLPEEIRHPVTKERRMSKHEVNAVGERSHLSPIKKPVSIEKVVQMLPEKKSPIPINDAYTDNDKDWLPKAPSPVALPTPVEKPGGHEKYMTEDKSLDSDSADKSSVKMIAKIQANLNENTMIKSPKTPMDARTATLDSLDVDHAMIRNIRKRSILDPERKFIAQDASHVQGVEISKSAKIPSAVNPNRSMFSPQPKENDFDYEMVAIDDGFNHDDIMKRFGTYPEFLFKEDTKEQGVQETLNLVDRLRMQLISKKNTVEVSAQGEPFIEAKDEKPEDLKTIKRDYDQEPVQEKEEALDLHNARDLTKEACHPVNHKPHPIPHTDLARDNREHKYDTKDYDRPIAMTSGDKWSAGPVAMTIPHDRDPDHGHDRELHAVRGNDQKYDHIPYNDEMKEPPTVQSDIQSLSETGDTISVCKHSDDSQSISVVDHSVNSNDNDLTQDNQNYDNNNSLIHSDCATISSPYVSQDKWRESKITTRRSSASSTNSDASICSQKAALKSHLSACEISARQVTIMPEIDSYPPVPAYSCTVEPSMPLNQYSAYPPNASPYLGTLSLPLFGNPASQLPLPSPGPLYSGLPYSTTPLMPPKPSFTMCAAFTSSSQNMALTTAMIASPTPKGSESPRDEIDVTGSDKFTIHVASSPSISVDSYEASNKAPPTKMSNDSHDSIVSINHESKSPSKTKPVTKFPGKSPGKSPGFSPKQSDTSKGTKRSTNRSNRNQRGRGRSKSRGHAYPPVDYSGNSIQSKLVGTVYDFHEEIANDSVDLKALRERRKSVDLCKSVDDRKPDLSYKDVSRSPTAVSSSPTTKMPNINDTKEIKPPTSEPDEKPTSPSENDASEDGPGFSRVHAVLPGPVDMRTYQSVEKPVPAAADQCHLLAFASGTADQHLPEIDEEVEKELHSALMASKPGEHSPPQPNIALEHNVVPKQIYTPQHPKVSLSDSRNQLKVKIKGPFLDANYATSHSQPQVAPPTPAPVLDTSTNVVNTIGISASTMMTGSTNLRRMRKKELLRQYWTQDMNMDDPAATSAMTLPPPAVPSPLTRAVITIPKAVASMTSIPTREDYKIAETPAEKKKRKVSSGLSRELRHLEVSMNDDVDPSDDIKLSSMASSSNQAHKRRGRATTKPNKTTASQIAPKLKIKIGANIVQQVNDETTGDQFRPPKKRSIHKTCLEDIRRENMKFRRKVMADFEETEKAKKYKPSKSEKRKKKKDKKSEKLQVVNSESESATKLIIKIKRKKDEISNVNALTLAGPSGAVSVAPEPVLDPFGYDPTAPDPLAIDTPSYIEASAAMRKVRTAKVTPIRLKLARSSQGSGYVMKEAVEPSANEPMPVSINKHCEVR